ncbi:hypothetical protein SMKI_04G6650 [Saccharomyces mikatae IFO 1815]|uniref:Sdc1p n=1 Tax=Saccharomyces mikatae IFO 1815 TaxID=226126 RepID=A0AA35IYY3_SACMI|nr:uncharacterized protein SMKI_04G6650 [Saccharomyces mikatae IFO 1815]CAI4038321.1 hypothetical protein SMKI_04G6650 [Saccharomyces mikatae IFO 1815]
MNENCDSSQYNETTIPMVKDTSSNNDIQVEQNQSAESKGHNNHDSGPFDINSNHSDKSGHLEMGSTSSSAAMDLKNVKSIGQSIKLEEAIDTNSIIEESTESKISNLENINLAATVGGSQTRKYLNANVTPHLLAGMRLIAVQQPEDPLRVLGEYLIEQSDILKSAKKNESNASV